MMRKLLQVAYGVLKSGRPFDGRVHGVVVGNSIYELNLVRRLNMKPQDFDNELGALVDAWCERRQLKLLRTILAAYPRVSGLTDEWGDLVEALKIIRVQHSSLLAPGEIDSVVELLHIAESVVYR